ncbi:uncharacterized protein LOC131994162 [Stomoxys calcitrans]|uniref:uncharacterized protein LOC131994162 n=1 Tax=Stomoxys calcitrans TaxID=35570 RepID=UPI0027E26521|nr:uncharacterized protein LOC131994162 [Stomoxys calcitrans]XP_059216562.1 uncharacterized protein LOC131994162 [Stomoxys calcitrans]
MAEKDRNSAKMLVILVSREQPLTFILPRESRTVQDLLEQVGASFDDNTTIQCVENPGTSINFVVTVGFPVQESASELISRAEPSRTFRLFDNRKVCSRILLRPIHVARKVQQLHKVQRSMALKYPHQQQQLLQLGLFPYLDRHHQAPPHRKALLRIKRRPNNQWSQIQ